MPIGLFWFAWTSLSHWILPIIGSGIFGCGTLLVFNGIFTFLGTWRMCPGRLGFARQDA